MQTTGTGLLWLKLVVRSEPHHLRPLVGLMEYSLNISDLVWPCHLSETSKGGNLVRQRKILGHTSDQMKSKN